MRRYQAFLAFQTLTLATILLGTAFARASDAWYQALAKPPFAPPDQVFWTVWAGVLVLIGAAAWRISETLPGPGRRVSLFVFVLQLALNVGWMIAFFGLQLPRVALAMLFALVLAVLADTLLFAQRDRVAAALMLPYLAWLGFAGYLNLGIVRLN